MPRKSKRKNLNQVFSYCSQPFQDEQRVTLRYLVTSDQIASVGAASYIVAQNDVFDCDVTSTGVQPLGFDQWAAIYARYVVLESSIDVAITSRTVSGRLSVAVAPNVNTTSLPLSFEACAGMRYARTGETTGGGPTVHLRQKIRTCDLFGVPPYAIESDDNFAAATTTNPNRRAAWAILCETSGSSDALSLTIALKYKVRFWTPNIVALSVSKFGPISALAALPARVTDSPTALPTPIPQPEPRPVCRALERGEIDGYLCTCGCMRRF